MRSVFAEHIQTAYRRNSSVWSIEWARNIYKAINRFEVEDIEWSSILVNGEESDAEI